MTMKNLLILLATMIIVKSPQLPFPIVAPSEHSEDLLILLATTRNKVADDDDEGSSDTSSNDDDREDPAVVVPNSRAQRAQRRARNV
jgi:hypothetical protein